MKYDEMVVERNVNVQSNCEHHFVVIDGLATVAYVPKQKVLGLSKINRIVEYFSKRPQIQERLNYIRKMGAGADAFRFEKEFMQQSDARLEFIKKIIDKRKKYLKVDTAFTSLVIARLIETVSVTM